MRESYFPSHPGVLQLASGTIIRTLGLAYFWTSARTVSVVILLVLPAFVAFVFCPLCDQSRPDQERRDRITTRFLVILGALAFLLTAACFAPASSALSERPPDRTLSIPLFVLVCVTALWSFVAGAALKQAIGTLLPQSRALVLATMVLMTGLLLLGPMRSTAVTLAFVPAMREYAVQWDARDSQLPRPIVRV